MKFKTLSLAPELLKTLQDADYHTATPIQEQAIPQVLKGRDIIGCAQTGTGKTAAFSLPTLQRLMTTRPEPSGAQRRRQRNGRRAIRALIVAPTRELAAQIGDSLATYGQGTRIRHTVIFGGVGQTPQVNALRNGVDILVATPGRLLDLIGQGYVKLGNVEVLILDEADHMLDMGFIHDLRKIVAHVPAERQTLMFSATMPPEIRELASSWLRRPFEVKVAPVASTPERVGQAVYFVAKKQKPAALTRLLYDTNAINDATASTDRRKTIVFSRTKHGADKIARNLVRDGFEAVAIHGNKSQTKRQAVIRQFGSDRPPILVATDLAARGLDFSDVSHVVNYDMPDTPETYVHRIGRTARAGTSGQAVSFCDGDERRVLRMIEKLTGQTVPVQTLDGIVADENEAGGKSSNGKTGSGRRKQFSSRNNRGRRSGRKSGAANSSTGGNARSSETGRSEKPASGKPGRRRTQTTSESVAPASGSSRRRKQRPGKNARRNRSEQARSTGK